MVIPTRAGVRCFAAVSCGITAHDYINMRKNRNIALDDHDHRLLTLLQRDTSATAEALGSEIGLSASSIQRRIKRLRANGVIEREVALLNADALGKRMTFIVGVKVDYGKKAEVTALQKRLLADPRTQQAYYVTGEVDLILTVVVQDMQDYDNWSKTLLLASPAMLRFQSNVVIEALRVGLQIAL